MRIRAIEVLLLVMAFTFTAGFNAFAAQEDAPPAITVGSEPVSAATTTTHQTGWLERDSLTGDWGGGRTWLKVQLR